MSKADQKLDQLLGTADAELAIDHPLPEGAQIRRLAQQRRTVKRFRRNSGIGISVGFLLLVWLGNIWPPLTPELPVSNAAKNAPPATRPATPWLAEREQLEAEQREIKQAYDTLLARVELDHLSRRIAALERARESLHTNFQKDRTAWLALQNLLPNPTSSLQIADQWRVRAVAEAFPKTAAGALAQSILNHENPEIPFHQKRNESYPTNLKPGK